MNIISKQGFSLPQDCKLGVQVQVGVVQMFESKEKFGIIEIKHFVGTYFLVGGWRYDLQRLEKA